MKNSMVRLEFAALITLLACGSLTGCGPRSEPTLAGPPTIVASPARHVTPTFPPTWTPRPPTPTYTRVVPIPATFTPGPSPTPTRLPARTKGVVVGIQDSHTLEIVIEGQPISRVFAVRLLGIEPPLLSDPWAGVALEWLAQQVGRQVVTLESDGIERDAQGNLLRYVWKEGRMVNVMMVQLGLATAAEDVAALRFGADLLDAQADAQSAERGLWGPPPTSTATPITPTATLTGTQIATNTPHPQITPAATQTANTTRVP